MANIYGTGDKGKATRLHAEIVRSRGRCEGPGSHKGVAWVHSQKLECAHIISRRFSATRTSTDNALCLCSACHRYFTDHPVEFADFVMEKIGRAKYEQLWQDAHRSDGKVDWSEEVERLKAIKGAA